MRWSAEQVERILLRRSLFAWGGHRYLSVWISDSTCGRTGRAHRCEHGVSYAVTLLFWALTTDAVHLCPPPSFSFLPRPVVSLYSSSFPPLTPSLLFLFAGGVSQLTIWPTKDPKRLSSTTVQAMTGWEKARELETERRYYVQYSLPSLIICHSSFLLCQWSFSSHNGRKNSLSALLL